MKCAAEPSLLVIQGPLKMLPGDSRIFFFSWGDTGDTQNKARGEGYSTGTYYPYRALHSQSLSEIAGSLLVPSLQKQNGRQSLQLSGSSPVEPVPSLDSEDGHPA